MLYWDVTSSACQQIKSSMSIWTKLWSILMTLWCATPVLKNMRSINDWFSDVKESSVICEIGDVLIYTEENQVPWSHQWTWSYKLGHGESEVHPRVEGTHQCEELRSFLRWAIYYNIFVEGYYKRTTPLKELLKKGHLNMKWPMSQILQRCKGGNERSSSWPFGHEQAIWGENRCLWLYFGRGHALRRTFGLLHCQLWMRQEMTHYQVMHLNHKLWL